MLDNNVFFDIVIKALKERERFSTVRMSDGEHRIIKWARAAGTLPNTPIDNYLFDAGWHKRFGTSGITASEIYKRLENSFDLCTYFCPGDSVQYLFEKHENPYVDNSYHYEWTRAQRTELLMTAKRVAVVNRDVDVFNKMRATAPEVEMKLFPIDNWRQTYDVYQAVKSMDYPLVLLSGGPGAKHISPMLAELSPEPKMVLDIGQGADAWWMKTGIEAV